VTIDAAVVAAVVEWDSVTAPEPSAECPPLGHETLMERVETLKRITKGGERPNAWSSLEPTG